MSLLAKEKVEEYRKRDKRGRGGEVEETRKKRKELSELKRHLWYLNGRFSQKNVVANEKDNAGGAENPGIEQEQI